MAKDIWFRKTKDGGCYYTNVWDPVERVKIKEPVGPDRAEALARAAKIKAEILSRSPGRKRRGPIPTISEYTPQFLSGNYSNDKARDSAERVLRLFVAHEGDVRLDKVTKGMLHDYVARRLNDVPHHPYNTGRVEEGRIAAWQDGCRRRIAKTTVNRETDIIKRILNHACEAEVLESNPVATFQKFSGRDIKARRRTRYLFPQEIQALLREAAHSRNPLFLPAMILSLYLGRRRGEILGLRRQDYDRANAFLQLKNTKDGTPQVVPVPPEAQKVLDKLHDETTRDWLFPAKDLSGPVADMDTAFRIAKRNAGLEDFRWHDLRHTAISYMLMSGVDIFTVAHLVGHTTATMIEQRYGHLSPGHKQASAVVFGRYMDRLKGDAPAAEPSARVEPWIPVVQQVAAMLPGPTTMPAGRVTGAPQGHHIPA